MYAHTRDVLTLQSNMTPQELYSLAWRTFREAMRAHSGSPFAYEYTAIRIGEGLCQHMRTADSLQNDGRWEYVWLSEDRRITFERAYLNRAKQRNSAGSITNEG